MMYLGRHECVRGGIPWESPGVVRCLFKVKSAKGWRQSPVWTSFPFHTTLFQTSRPLLLYFLQQLKMHGPLGRTYIRVDNWMGSIETSTYSSRFTKQYWSACGQKSKAIYGGSICVSHEYTSSMGLLELLSILDERPILKLARSSWFLPQCRILEARIQSTNLVINFQTQVRLPRLLSIIEGSLFW